MDPFELWSPEHLAILVLTILMPVALGWWVRLDTRGRRARLGAIGFASVLMVQLVLSLLLVGLAESREWTELMPLHLCHFALFACVDACLTHRRLSFELAYFWGLGGTLQGLITPGLVMGFPSAEFVLFFLGHSGIVASVIYLMWAFRMRPQWKSVFRAFAAISGYALIAGAFNTVFDTNYGFLCEKPHTASLFDFMGDWPWYIASAAGLCLVVFILLYLPWAVVDRRPAGVKSGE